MSKWLLIAGIQVYSKWYCLQKIVYTWPASYRHSVITS